MLGGQANETDETQTNDETQEGVYKGMYGLEGIRQDETN